VSDVGALLGGAKLSQLLGGYLPPRKRFEITLQRADDRGAPVTVAAVFAVRALSVEEQERAHSAAIEWLLKLGGHAREDLISESGNNVFELELMTQLLALALMDPESPRAPVAKDAASLRALLFADEIEACFREYAAFQSERSPIRSIRSADELAEVIDALGKGRASSINWLRYDVISLRSIITTLADRASRQTRPNYSDTSPPSPSPDASSEATMTISEG
jgi:hypothetical protein